VAGEPSKVVLTTKRVIRRIGWKHVSLKERVVQRGPVVGVAGIHAPELNVCIVVEVWAVYPTSIGEDMSESALYPKLAVSLYRFQLAALPKNPSAREKDHSIPLKNTCREPDPTLGPCCERMDTPFLPDRFLV
jgi:hypothetical protein